MGLMWGQVGDDCADTTRVRVWSRVHFGAPPVGFWTNTLMVIQGESGSSERVGLGVMRVVSSRAR